MTPPSPRQDQQTAEKLGEIEGLIRDLAVENVDRREGCTVENWSDAGAEAQHREAYDDEEVRLYLTLGQVYVERGLLHRSQVSAPEEPA